MSTPAPSLAAMLLYVYDTLTPGQDYLLTEDGSSIATWTPRQGNLPRLTVDQITKAYNAMQSRDAYAAKIAAAEAALLAFWAKLSPFQKKTLLTFEAAIANGLEHDTATTILALNDEAKTITRLSPLQTTLKTTAMTAVNAILTP